MISTQIDIPEKYFLEFWVFKVILVIIILYLIEIKVIGYQMFENIQLNDTFTQGKVEPTIYTVKIWSVYFIN